MTDYQVYSGTAAPINFNGLVRQYYLRDGAHLGDIQVNLVDAIAPRTQEPRGRAVAAVRPVQSIAAAQGGNAKIVEVPPGPPVMSPAGGRGLRPRLRGADRRCRRFAMRRSSRPRYRRCRHSVGPSREGRGAGRSRSRRPLACRRQHRRCPGIALGGDDASLPARRTTSMPCRSACAASRSRRPGRGAGAHHAADGALVPVSEMVAVVPAVREPASSTQGPAAGGVRDRRHGRR